MKLSQGLVADCLSTLLDCARATVSRGFHEVQSSHPIAKGERGHVSGSSGASDAARSTLPFLVAVTVTLVRPRCIVCCVRQNLISIPGATSLWVWFDARCCLDVHPGGCGAASSLTAFGMRCDWVVWRDVV